MASTLIVGAGPSGLVLALSLLRNGVSVRIIEKRPNHPIGQRGSGIQSRTLELYKTLGILPDILNLAREAQPIRVYTSPEGPEPISEMRMVEHLEETPAYPLINSLMLGQDRHEAIIRECLANDYNVHVELGTELKSFVQTDDYVEALLVKHIDGNEVEETVRTEFLVGTDGARSVVRKQLRLTFLGESHQGFGMVIGDLHIKSGIPDREYWRMWGDRDQAFVSLRPFETDDDRYNFLMGGRDIDLQKMANDREALFKQISAFIGREIEFSGLIWSGIWSPNIRMVNKFGVNRVFVAGDAAHVHSPTGGQGMNSGVQDSINLAWKMALVHNRHAPLSFLTSYTEERLPVIAVMLNKTTELMNLNFQPINEVGFDTRLTRGFELRQLGVNYRGSPFIVDEKYPETNGVVDPYRGGLDGIARGGDRTPAAPGLRTEDGSTTTLFDLLSPSKHTILVFADENGGIIGSDILTSVNLIFPVDTSQIAVVYPRSYSGSKTENSRSMAADHRVLIDDEGYAFKHYNVGLSALEDKFRVFVVRPDGYIGAIVEGEEGLKKYGEVVFRSR